MFSFLLTGCTPTEKCLQVDYIENGECKHIFLNVIDYGDSYKVISQEYIDEEPDFLIINIFDYNAK